MIRIKFFKTKQLKETPLGDIVDYDNGENGVNPKRSPESWKSKHSSVAYNSSVEFKAEAKLLWKNTKHNWILITMENITTTGVHDPQLLRWIESQHFPSPSKILVVGSAPFVNDFDSPAWQTGHDIIGHTIDMTYKIDHKTSELANDLYADGHLNVVWAEVIQFMWRQLPKELRLSTDSYEDLIPDILFGFFSKKLDMALLHNKLTGFLRHKAATELQKEKATEIATQFIKIFVDAVRAFEVSVPDDKPFLIRPF